MSESAIFTNQSKPILEERDCRNFRTLARVVSNVLERCSRAGSRKACIELAGGNNRPLIRFFSACKVRYSVASVRRRRPGLVGPLDLICRRWALGPSIHRGIDGGIAECQTSRTRFPYRHAIHCFLLGISGCRLLGLAFRRRRLVRVPRDPYSCWIDGNVLPPDLCRPPGNPAEKMEHPSACCDSRVGGDCVCPHPLDESILAAVCGMVDDISVFCLVLARNGQSRLAFLAATSLAFFAPKSLGNRCPMCCGLMHRCCYDRGALRIGFVALQW